jgi:hypothetical protein
LQIARRRFEVGMSEQDLNGAEIHAGFQQVGGEGVPEGLLVVLMIRTQRRSAIAITRSMA